MASVNCHQGRWPSSCLLCGDLVIGKDWRGRWTLDNIVTGIGPVHKKCYKRVDAQHLTLEQYENLLQVQKRV
jgi:hypothetical protein